MGLIPVLVVFAVGAMVGAAWNASRYRRRHFSAIVDSVEGSDGSVYYQGTYCEIPAPDDEQAADGDPLP
jgi:hypothetical protein